jgi:hypothetical protein
MKKKYPIISVSFGAIYLGIGCNHGKIYIHDNSSLDLIFKITQNSITKISENKNKTFGSTAKSVIISKGNKNNNEEVDINKNNDNDNNTQSLLFEVRNRGYSKKQEGFYNVLFDINNNCIVYEIIKDKKIKKE